MLERREHKPYWRHTKFEMLARLIPLLLVLIVVPFYAERLNHNKLLGFPLGFLMAGHGLLILSIITVASSVNRQDAVDRWHGALEDA